MAQHAFHSTDKNTDVSNHFTADRLSSVIVSAKCEHSVNPGCAEALHIRSRLFHLSFQESPKRNQCLVGERGELLANGAELLPSPSREVLLNVTITNAG